MKRIRYFLMALTLLSFGAPTQSVAQTDDKLIGVWSLVKIEGAPLCLDLIKDINYSFSGNGDYEIRARMLRPGGIRRENVNGTFEADEKTITGLVNGITVGPFRYRFYTSSSGEPLLVISESNPACDIFLRHSEEEW